jgi:hypothetical protein
MGNMFSQASRTTAVTSLTRDDVVGTFVDNLRSTFQADIGWASGIPEAYAQLRSWANEPGVVLDDLKTQARWKEASAKLTKIPLNPSAFAGAKTDDFSDIHPIAKLICKQDRERSFLFEIDLGDRNGRLICLRDKHRPCEINSGMEDIEKPLWIKLQGWSSDAKLGFDKPNASSGGPNLWWVGSEGIMNISQLSTEKHESLKNAMQKNMGRITTMVVQHMADVCNSDTSRAAFRTNGFTDEEITLFVKHMKIQGAMDLLLTMQASDGKGCANTSVPIPHMQTNPGFRRAYLEATDLSQQDLEERIRLVEINTRMMQIFATQMEGYKGQMRFPFN